MSEPIVPERCSARIGEMSKHVTVGFVGSMSDLFVEHGVPLLRGQNIEPYRLNLGNLKYIDLGTHKKWKKSALDEGDVAIVRVGYPGTAAVIPPGMGALNAASLVIVRPDPARLSSKYLAYVLNSPWGKATVSSLLVGSAQQVLNTKTVSSLEIPTPSIETQRRIASILGAYDDLIDINRRRIAVLEEMARGLFEEWFVRFRFPGHEAVPTLDTPDGPLPEGWAFAPLDGFVVLQRGFDLPKSSRVHGDIPVFSASGFHGGHNEHKVNGPGLVTGRSGTIGQVHLVMENFWPLNTTLYVREFRRAGPAYGLFLLRHMELAKHSSGSAVPTLNRNHIHNIKLPAAPQSLIDRFETFAFANLQWSRIIELQNERLVSSRDLLLPRLISGQLSVTEAERELEEAA